MGNIRYIPDDSESHSKLVLSSHSAEYRGMASHIWHIQNAEDKTFPKKLNNTRYHKH